MFDIKTTTSDYMSIVLTHECNKRCVFCIDQYRGQDEYISLKSVESALTFAKGNGIKDILLVGGEPTLHPQVVSIAKMVKDAGFNVILTTNYTNPKVFKELDQYVDSFNISWYHQNNLPKQEDFTADITLSALIFRKQLDSKEKLDRFIDEHSDLTLQFSMLFAHDEWTKSHQDVPFLNDLPGERVVLFDEIEGIIYRGYVIKRYDRLLNESAKQSYKCHVDGTISTSWNRSLSKLKLSA